MQLIHKGVGGLAIRFDATDHVEVYQVDVGIFARSTTTITDTAAHMIAVTKTGTTTKIYVDNVDVTNPVADSTVSATTGTLVMAGSP